jgi:hypothetical protein
MLNNKQLYQGLRAAPMTLPDERYRAVKWAESFLKRLAGGELPRVPKAVRTEARSILRHYPNAWDMDRAADAAPEVFQQQMEDLHKFVTKGQQEVLAREQQLKEKLEFIAQK